MGIIMFFGGGFPFENMGGPDMGPPKNVDNSKYYNLLGVQKDATESDIKKSYKKNALKFHPDRPDGDAEKFKEMSKADETLVNKEKREIYDKYGEEGLSENNMNFSSAEDIFS